MIPDLLAQLEKSSKKVIFYYNLQTNQFDFLSQTIEPLWEVKRELILASPPELGTNIHPEDREIVLQRLSQVINGEAREVTFCLKLGDETIKQVMVDAHPIVDPAGLVSAIAGIAEDVTQKVKYTNYLVEYARRKDSMLAIVAHDLRSPLAHVRGIANLLQAEHAQQDYEQLTDYIGIIQNAYEECNNLISELLSDEHLKSPTIHVNKVRLDAVGMVQSVVNSFSKAKLVEVEFEVNSTQEKIMVELDEVKLMQIINNLISNSIKFTPPGGKVTITLSQEGHNLLLTHADTGIGIPEKLKRDVFTRYNQTSRLGLRGEKTNGVGMSIVFELVEIQGGKIWFESEENQGTTFYLTFPMSA